MKQIFGLIIKDILQIKFYRRNIILSIILYCVFIFLQKDNQDIASVGTIMIMTIFSMMSATTFSYDEKTKADTYIPTLPLNRKQIVISKYLLSFILLIVGMIIGVVISSILVYISSKTLPNFNTILPSILGGLAGLSLLQCIQIPCIYKLGAEKGRVQVYVVLMVLVGLIAGIVTLFPNILNYLSFIKDIYNLLPLITIIMIIAFYYISYIISYKIYKRKEL